MRRRNINELHEQRDHRLDELRKWLAEFDGLDPASLAPASADASFRRYFRIRTKDGTLIAMDAPPEQEDCSAFLTIARYLEEMGLNAPRVVRADANKGFLLLTDLGSTQYLAELDERPGRADELYGDALASLEKMQTRGRRFQSRLPGYNAQLLRFEMSLFRDWLCGRHLGIAFARREEDDWSSCVEHLVENALSQPKVFVHRDFHSRNLMVTESNNPGVLDFQDAVEGPFTYDLVSLLKDCYISLPRDRVRERAMEFHECVAAPNHAGTDASGFLRSFELMGVQRHMKAAGIFARLFHRDGKDGYLDDIPRTLGYITEVASGYSELRFIGQLIAERILPSISRAACDAEPLRP